MPTESPVPVPPQELVDLIGGGDYAAIGREFFDIFVNVCGLRPDERVLDVGSGSGRMAVPLTDYLVPPGSYEGFDVSKPMVDWCRAEITSRFPHFTFTWVDLENGLYNVQGREPAETFKFPYGSGSFDFVFLTSVFTHLLPDAVENYVDEIRRVLVDGGRVLATFFLLNPESQDLMGGPASTIEFRYPVGAATASSPDRPEAAIAYPDEHVLELFERKRLRVSGVHHGTWYGRPGRLTYQDVVLADAA